MIVIKADSDCGNYSHNHRGFSMTYKSCVLLQFLAKANHRCAKLRGNKREHQYKQHKIQQQQQQQQQRPIVEENFDSFATNRPSKDSGSKTCNSCRHHILHTHINNTVRSGDSPGLQPPTSQLQSHRDNDQNAYGTRIPSSWNLRIALDQAKPQCCI